MWYAESFREKSPCQVDYHQLGKALEAKTSVSKLYMLNAYAFTVLLRQSLHSGFRDIKHERKLYHSWYLPSDSTLILGIAGVLDKPSP